jgi:hypothetical protein
MTTPDQHAAELRRILTTRRPDRIDLATERRLYAEERSHRDAITAAYAAARGWKETPKPFSARTLALGRMHDGNRRGGGYTLADSDLMDHVSNWRRGRWPVAIVAQPYNHNIEIRRVAFVAWGVARGLHVAFPTDFPSWYFPGSTVLIEITRAADAARVEQEYADADEL